MNKLGFYGKSQIYHNTEIHQIMAQSSKKWWKSELKWQIILHKNICHARAY